MWFDARMTSGRRLALVATSALLMTSLAACGDDDSGGDAGGDTALTVYAASSLTRTFEQIGTEFEAQHDGVTVEFSFGGSSDLVAQIQEGAPADVFASADTANMDKLTAEDLQAADPQNFATNTLEIAVPPDNPAGVASFADLANDGINVVVCAPEVPCGAATVKVEEATGVDIQPVSEEQSVTDVLAKVTSGEADAGLVYVTDVLAAGADVEGITFPESSEAVNTYPMVALKDAADADLAQEFVDLVLSDTGQSILEAAGFAPASSSRHEGVTRQRPVDLPRWAYVPALVGVAFVLLPLVAIVAKVDWPNFLDLITSEDSQAALALSLRTSVASTVACIVLGVPLALVLARWDFRYLGLLRSLVLLPLVLPPVVGGLALLYTFGRRGLLGESLEALGVQIAFSTIAVVMAQTFVALPFLVVSLEGALRTAGDRYEVAAASLGASPTTVFRRITLPLVMPGLVSGAVLAFARALGEFGATITFAGSLQGRTRTLPLEIYLQRETDPDAAVALALVLLVVAVVVIGFARQGRSSI